MPKGSSKKQSEDRDESYEDIGSRISREGRSEKPSSRSSARLRSVRDSDYRLHDAEEVSDYDYNDYSRSHQSRGSRQYGYDYEDGLYGDYQSYRRRDEEEEYPSRSRRRSVSQYSYAHGGRRGGWFGDPEGHSEAAHRGWENPNHGPSGWFGDPERHSEAARRGWGERQYQRPVSSRDEERYRRRSYN